MHAVAIHSARVSDNSVYLGMVIFSNASFSKCPELELLAVRPVTRRGVRGLASMAARWCWYSRFRWVR